MQTVNFKPQGNRILVSQEESETITAGGIIIPDTAKEKPNRGIVVAVGQGKPNEPMTIAVGDKVLYGKYSGQEIIIDEKPYVIMRQDDVFGNY